MEVAWWIVGKDLATKVHTKRWRRSYGWTRTLCGKQVGRVQNLNGVRAIDAAHINGRCQICERIKNGIEGQGKE